MTVPMTVGALEAAAAVDPCEECPHAWHGLRCEIYVTSVGQGGVRHTQCGCPSQWIPPDV